MHKKDAEFLLKIAPEGWEYYSPVRNRFYAKVEGVWYAFEEGCWIKWVEPLRSTRLSFRTPAEIAEIYLQKGNTCAKTR